MPETRCHDRHHGVFAVGIYAIGLCNLAVPLYRGRRQGVRCKRNNR